MTENDPIRKSLEIEMILRSKKNIVDNVSLFKMRDLTQQFGEFTALSPLNHKKNRLAFSEDRKCVWLDFYEVSIVAHSHPVTQVIFSAY